MIDSMIDSSPAADDQIYDELSETVVIDSEFKSVVIDYFKSGETD